MREEFRRVLEDQHVPAGHHVAHLGKLKPDIKEKWLAALRSGKYKQTHGKLRNLLGHCCLGVAADVYDPSKWSSAAVYAPGAEGMYWEYADYIGDLPYHVVDSFGITTRATAILIYLNDDLRWDFIKIAAFIEEVL